VRSKRRAALHANELLKAAREERDSSAARGTRLLVAFFPELSACAPARRWSVIWEARTQAKLRKFVLLANLAALVPAAALIAAVMMDWEPRSFLVFAFLGTIVLGRCVGYVGTRRQLRSMLRSRTRSLTDDVAGGRP
jgi:hypothetical protein